MPSSPDTCKQSRGLGFLISICEAVPDVSCSRRSGSLLRAGGCSTGPFAGMQWLQAQIAFAKQAAEVVGGITTAVSP